MRIVMFCHSFASDWNHPHAHVLRGIATELVARGHDVQVFEPQNSSSRANLLQEQGPDGLQGFAEAYPQLTSRTYDLAALDLDRTLQGCDLVIVHEWSDPELIARLGAVDARRRGYLLLFHDSDDHAMSDPARIAGFDLRRYDAVLTGGDAVSRLYLERGWSRAVWTWPAGADVRVFYPHGRPPAPPASRPVAVDRRRQTAVEDGDEPARRWAERPRDGDLVWIGNYRDGERSEAIEEFLVAPVQRLGLRAVVYGVGYPDDVLTRFAAAGIEYRGWVPNYAVPDVLAQFAVTIHLPRSRSRASLQSPTLTTIRVFEALACGIPLVAAQSRGAGGVFAAGEDFLVAANSIEMTTCLQAVLTRPRLRTRLAEQGVRAIHSGHTCSHRVDDLLRMCDELRQRRRRALPAFAADALASTA